MAHIVTGLFSNSEQAGQAVAELKNKGYTDEISVISQDPQSGKIDTHSVKQDGSEGAVAGAGAGAVIAGGATLLAGITAVAIPGVGLVAGAIATALAATAAGAVTGGIVGWLVDKGIPDNKAKEYEDRIHRGDVLIAVEVDHEQEPEVQAILDSFGSDEGTTTQHHA